MTSAKQARRQRRAAAPPPPVRPRGAARRASPRVLLGAGAGLSAVVVAIVLVIALTGSSKKATVAPLPGEASVAQLLHGIPQRGQVLGSAGAPVTVVEYIDLQCPSCRLFETEVMPSIVDKYVRTGKVRIEARPVAIIGPDSVLGQRAALAAARQSRLFDFAQIIYLNQGTENSGWLDETTVRSAALGVPGLDGDALWTAQGSREIRAAAERIDAQAKADRVSGTPTVYVGRTGSPQRVEVSPGLVPSVAAMSNAIDRALR